MRVTNFRAKMCERRLQFFQLSEKGRAWTNKFMFMVIKGESLECLRIVFAKVKNGWKIVKLN
jgi:hypothetical protein